MLQHRMRLVLIGGLSCSGKTTLAESLARQWQAPILRLDDYYLPLTELTFEERTRRNFDAPDILDIEMLSAHVAALAEGRSIEVPDYDFVAFTRSAHSHTVRPREVLIVEGQLALHFPELVSRAETRVFLDVCPEECLNRRIARDVRTRGRTPEEVRMRFNRDVRPMYEAYVLPSRAHATHILSAEECRRMVDGAYVL